MVVVVVASMYDISVFATTPAAAAVVVAVIVGVVAVAVASNWKLTCN